MIAESPSATATPATSPFMERALQLAASVFGSTSPNPGVGAVLVRDGHVVGEGATQPPGGAHAEVGALRQAGDAARGAALYATLEPCCVAGRTPPCTAALIEAGVTEVHCALIDPDERVRGRGAAQLRQAGIRVSVGDGESASRRLLEGYIKHRLTGLPLVTAKFAASLDGKIAARTGDSKWVSGEETRVFTHRERSLVDAILVGGRTVLIDDPQMTARPEGTPEGVRQPLRVVMDSSGRIPEQARILQGPGKVLFATTDRAPIPWRAEMVVQGAEVLVLPERQGHVDPEELIAALGKRGVLTLLVEGGGRVLGSMFDLDLVDKVQAIMAPIIVGGADAPTAVEGEGVEQMAHATRLMDVTVTRVGQDIIIQGHVPGRGPDDWVINPAADAGV
ncbi:MAG: bifunctional diaminohydroxyphosphoribosylaminopyrimidine deaminase/5-amino-6-(5-phosphoribosylamino)uracil reductase RibD [Dehalococcoidia bacterium]